MRPNILFLLTLTDLSIDRFAATIICPQPVVDQDTGVVYNTNERFDRIRKEVGNTLSTKFVHHRVNNKDEEYEYTLTFCGEKNEAAVTQIEKESTTSKSHKIAVHDGSSVLVGAEDWLLLQYKNGEKYGHHCKKQPKQAWVYIRCEDQGEKPQLRVIEEARYDSDDKKHADTICYFLFEYNHPAACSSPKKKSLSGGAVFCIIIIVLFAAYFIFGFIYQRFVLHATGLEQIPQYCFWRKFGNTMADGCDFVCRSKETSNSYKGITDDLDLESSDDDKDGLLPM